MESNDENKTLEELLISLNNSMKDIHDHPTHTDRLPSNMEILIRGVTDSKAVDFLFSDKMDNILNTLFKNIETGNFEKIISNKDKIEELLDNCFGKGSFRGPVSQAVLTNIQASVQSKRYAEMKSNLGKAALVIKKLSFIMKNLKKGKNQFKRGSEEYNKYKDAVYAIKQVLKFANRVYYNRRLINRKVWNGLNNIVHEDMDYEEE